VLLALFEGTCAIENRLNSPIDTPYCAHKKSTPGRLHVLKINPVPDASLAENAAAALSQGGCCFSAACPACPAAVAGFPGKNMES
jgi:hypothetical protein